MDGGESDHAVRVIGRDEQRVWRRVVDDELVPVARREHRTLHTLSEEGPSIAHRCGEHCGNRLRVLGGGTPEREVLRIARVRRASVAHSAQDRTSCRVMN
jgi:hypothetical protein